MILSYEGSICDTISLFSIPSTSGWVWTLHHGSFCMWGACECAWVYMGLSSKEQILSITSSMWGSYRCVKEVFFFYILMAAFPLSDPPSPSSYLLSAPPSTLSPFLSKKGNPLLTRQDFPRRNWGTNPATKSLTYTLSCLQDMLG